VYLLLLISLEREVRDRCLDSCGRDMCQWQYLGTGFQNELVVDSEKFIPPDGPQFPFVEK
jgi:hypothetical protein